MTLMIALRNESHETILHFFSLYSITSNRIRIHNLFRQYSFYASHVVCCRKGKFLYHKIDTTSHDQTTQKECSKKRSKR